MKTPTIEELKAEIKTREFELEIVHSKQGKRAVKIVILALKRWLLDIERFRDREKRRLASRNKKPSGNWNKV